MIATIVNGKARKFNCKKNVAEKILREEGHDGYFVFVDAPEGKIAEIIEADGKQLLKYREKTKEELDNEKLKLEEEEQENKKQRAIELQMRIDAGKKLKLDMSKEEDELKIILNE